VAEKDLRYGAAVTMVSMDTDIEKELTADRGSLIDGH
jgi:hypothetical protein